MHVARAWLHAGERDRSTDMSMTTSAVSAGSHCTAVWLESHSSRPNEGMYCWRMVSDSGEVDVDIARTDTSVNATQATPRQIARVLVAERAMATTTETSRGGRNRACRIDPTFMQRGMHYSSCSATYIVSMWRSKVSNR